MTIFANKEDAISRIREFNKQFVWEGGSEKYELCWSDCRDGIDCDRVTDDAILTFGNRIRVNIFGSPVYGLTVDGYLYMLDAELLEMRRRGGDPIILLYRASWDNIEITGINEIRLNGRKEV